MIIVEHTELGKYYMAYWSTHIVKVIVVFRQCKPPMHGGYARVDDEHFIYTKLNRWDNDNWIEVHPREGEKQFTSLSFYSHIGDRDAIIYELNEDDIKNHIVLETI